MKLEVLPVTLTAGQRIHFDIAGRYVEVIDATGPFDLFFADANGGFVGDARAVQSGIYVAAGFAGFDIASATAQAVTLLITDGTGGSRRQPGVVQVVDTNKARTIAGAAFALPASRAASAAVFARCGLVNQTGNTKRAIVERLRYGTNGAATSFIIGMVAQANLGGLGTGASSKLSGGAVSSCVSQADSSASFALNMTQVFYNLPGTSGEIALPTPIVLTPGWGLVVNISTANQDAFLGIDFFEESL